jgi:HK97 family phage portal protein
VSLFFERRSISFQEAFARGDSMSLFGSSIEAGLRLVPVYSATSLICDTVSTLPLRVYRDLGEGVRDRVKSQPKLVTAPAPFGGRIAWVHQAMSSLLLRGNATGVVLASDSSGTPSTVAWQHPDCVRVDESQYLPRFFVREVEVPAESIVHIPAYVLPGSIVGLSPLRLFKMQFEAGMQAQKFGLDWYRNGTAPTGKLRNTEQVVSAKEAAKVKARFKEAVRDGDLFVTGSDWDYESLSVDPADAQFLQQIKATATQVAAIYRVAPEDIGGESGSSLTYSTLEQNDLKFAKRALLPWTARFEEALTNLLPRPQYARFNLDAVSRADLMTRMQAHDIALKNGLETNDEGRALEERPPLTSEQINQWQNLYGPRAGQAPTTATTG